MPSMSLLPPPQLTHRPSIQRFLQWLEESWEYGYIGLQNDSDKKSRKFIDILKLRTYLSKENLVAIIKELLPEARRPHDLASTILGEYLRLFALLLKLREGGLIVEFIRTDQFTDVRLPLQDARDKPAHFPVGHKEEFFAEFQREQWHFFPKFFKNMITEEKKFEEERILPILEVKPLRTRRGHSTTSRVVLSGTYNELNNSPRRGSMPRYRNILVLKTYKKINHDHYTRETEEFKHLRYYSRNDVPGLVKFYGSFSYKETYNVLLEWADQGTLEDYFNSVKQPVEYVDRKDFWDRILNLAEPLKHLHRFGKGENAPDDVQALHQDITLSNILVFSNGDTDAKYKWTFKIADLGTSHFKHHTRDDTTHFDSQGTRENGAPETYRGNTADGYRMPVTSKVDVWSYACILSNAATWLVRGKEGIDNFRKIREKATPEDFADKGCFHDGHKVLDAVTRYHDDLKQYIPRIDVYTPEVLSLADELLKREGPRLDGVQLYDKAQEIQNKLKQMIPSRISNDIPVLTRDKPPPIQPVTMPVTPPEPSPSMSVGPAPRKVPEWPLSEALEWREARKRAAIYSPPNDPHVLLPHLDGRDHIFIIDCASTMSQHWDDVKKVIDVLAYILKRKDDDGLDLIFTDGTSSSRHYKTTTSVLKDISDRKPSSKSKSSTHMDHHLEQVFFEHSTSLEKWHTQNLQSPITPRRSWMRPWTANEIKIPKPITVYVLTDGIWQPESNGVKPIQDFVARLEEYKIPTKQAGLQFIYFGTDEQGEDKLNHLDDLKTNLSKEGIIMKRDIVDMEPANLNVWKMLLGSLLPWFDNSDCRNRRANTLPSRATGD